MGNRFCEQHDSGACVQWGLLADHRSYLSSYGRAAVAMPKLLPLEVELGGPRASVLPRLLFVAEESTSCDVERRQPLRCALESLRISTPPPPALRDCARLPIRKSNQKPATMNAHASF